MAKKRKYNFHKLARKKNDADSHNPNKRENHRAMKVRKKFRHPLGSLANYPVSAVPLRQVNTLLSVSLLLKTSFCQSNLSATEDTASFLLLKKSFH